jgi:hypothetical protein
VECNGCVMWTPQADDHREARAVMCMGRCSRKDAAGDAIQCTISGNPVEYHITSCSPSCPRGRHPDRRGVLRWAGIRWYGVPRPIAWAYRIRQPWCGCCYVLKNLWLVLINADREPGPAPGTGYRRASATPPAQT